MGSSCKPYLIYILIYNPWGSRGHSHLWQDPRPTVYVGFNISHPTLACTITHDMLRDHHLKQTTVNVSQTIFRGSLFPLINVTALFPPRLACTSLTRLTRRRNWRMTWVKPSNHLNGSDPIKHLSLTKANIMPTIAWYNLKYINLSLEELV